MPPLGSEFVTDAPSVRMSAGRTAAAVGNKVRAGTGGVALIVHLGDARRQIDQCDYVAVDQRQVIDEPAIDHLAGFRIFGLDGLRFAASTWTVWLAPATFRLRFAVAFSLMSTLKPVLTVFPKPLALGRNRV